MHIPIEHNLYIHEVNFAEILNMQHVRYLQVNI